MLQTFWSCDKKFLVGKVFFQSLNNGLDKTLSIKTKYKISVSVVSDSVMKKLNKSWRKINKTTDVLAFSFIEGKKVITKKENWLGEIIISHQKASEQAKKIGHSQRSEMARLYVHGVLHLLGYDHQNKNQESKMKKLENQVLNKAGYKL